MERFRSNEQMPHIPGFECSHIVAREISMKVDEMPEQNADVTLFNRHETVFFPNLPLALCNQPPHESGNGRWYAFINRFLRHSTVHAIWLGYRQRDNGRLA